MGRLPNPGGDDGQWGSILNDYLAQAHAPTGELKTASVGTSQLQDGSVTTTKVSVSGASSGQFLGYNGSAIAWATPLTGGRTVTGVKTGNYSAASGEYVIVNPTAAGFTVTLPSAPVSGSLVSLKNIGTNSNAVLIVPGTGATIEDNGNYSGTSVSLNTVQVCMDFVYNGSGRWYRIG